MAGKYVTEANGVYSKVPTSGPLSMEIFVEQGQTLSTSYHGFRKTLEEEPDRWSDPFYMNVYYRRNKAASSESTKGNVTKEKNEYTPFLTPEGKKRKALEQTKQEAVDASNKNKWRELRLKAAQQARARGMEARKKGAAKEVAEMLKKYEEENKKEASESFRAQIEKKAAEDWAVDEVEEVVETEEEEPVVVKKGPKRVKLELPE